MVLFLGNAKGNTDSQNIFLEFLFRKKKYFIVRFLFFIFMKVINFLKMIY